MTNSTAFITLTKRFTIKVLDSDKHVGLLHLAGLVESFIVEVPEGFCKKPPGRAAALTTLNKPRRGGCWPIL